MAKVMETHDVSIHSFVEAVLLPRQDLTRNGPPHKATHIPVQGRALKTQEFPVIILSEEQP